MRILLSTIGSRGDVQPLVALAQELMKLGQDVRLCAPPDFVEWAQGLGVATQGVGPRLRSHAVGALRPIGAQPPSADQMRDLAAQTVASQFEALDAAGRDCDLILAGGALQFAARSAAERRGARYVYAAYCPVTLPSPAHAPPPLFGPGLVDASSAAENERLWALDAARWNDRFLAPLNAERGKLGLQAVEDARSHVFTDAPLLAADGLLAPAPATPGLSVTQTGAWLLPDAEPLPEDLETFLEAGEAPVYLGFGSMRIAPEISSVLAAAARAAGRRAVIHSGWAGLDRIDGGDDCIVIGEVNQQALFPRVAAIVHHGGAGTTTAAACAGAPQVVIPQFYDQHYWAQRVADLGLGAGIAKDELTVQTLASALAKALDPATASRARTLAQGVTLDGAAAAARWLVSLG